MATAGDLVVNLTSNTRGFTKGMSRAKQEATGLDAVVGRLKSTIYGMGVVGAAATAGFVGWGIKLAADAETAETALTTMLGSATQAKNMMAEIKAFAAATPFQQMDLITAARNLLSFGSAADQVMGQLQMLGDLASGSGSRLTELVAIYGKVNAIGKASLENINQLAERGIPIYKVLQKQVGLTGEELRKFISTGGVTASVFNEALSSMTAQGGIFFDSMAKQSKTLSGLWSTLKDNIAQLAEGLGKLLLPVLKMLVDMTTALVQGLNRLLGITEDVSGKTIKSSAAKLPDMKAEKPVELPIVPKVNMPDISKIAFPMADSFMKRIRQSPQLLGAVMKGSGEAMRKIESVRQQRNLDMIAESQLNEQQAMNRHLAAIQRSVESGAILGVATL